MLSVDVSKRITLLQHHGLICWALLREGSDVCGPAKEWMSKRFNEVKRNKKGWDVRREERKRNE